MLRRMLHTTATLLLTLLLLGTSFFTLTYTYIMSAKIVFKWKFRPIINFFKIIFSICK